MNLFNNQILYSLCLISIVLSGCREPQQFIVKGVVSDFYTQSPIENVQLQFAYSALENGTFSSTFKEIETVTTSADGSYEVIFDFVSAVEYQIIANKEGYFEEEVLLDRSEWAVSEENVLPLSIFGKSEVDVKLINNTHRDQFLLKFLSHSENCQQCCLSNSTYSFGDFTDTTFSCLMYANQNLTYELVNVAIGEPSRESAEVFIERGANEIIIDLAN